MTDIETPEDPDTGYADPEIQDTPAPDAADSAATPEQAEDTDHSQPQSVTESDPGTPAANAPPTADELKRLRGFETLAGQLGREVGEHRKFRSAYEGLPPAEELRHVLQRQQEDAQRTKLHAWNPRHPEYLPTAKRLERVDAFAAAQARELRRIEADPNLDQQSKSQYARQARQELAQSMGVSDDDIELYNQKKQNAAQVQEEMASDPDEFINRRATEVAQQVFQQMWSQQTAQHQARSAASTFSAQHNDLIQANREEFVHLLPRMGRDAAIEYLTMKDRVRALESGAGESVTLSEAAKAQQQALHKRARVTRDASTQSGQQDPVALAVKAGFRPNTPQFVRFIREYAEKHNQ